MTLVTRYRNPHYDTHQPEQTMKVKGPITAFNYFAKDIRKTIEQENAHLQVCCFCGG